MPHSTKELDLARCGYMAWREQHPELESFRPTFNQLSDSDIAAWLAAAQAVVDAYEAYKAYDDQEVQK